MVTSTLFGDPYENNVVCHTHDVQRRVFYNVKTMDTTQVLRLSFKATYGSTFKN